MLIIRYAVPTAAGALVGLLHDDGTIRRLDVPSLAALLRLSLVDLRAAVERGGARESGRVRLLPPVDERTEVWASGVTYVRSREARREESSVADVYALVYEADRPELFFKGPAWRTSGDAEPIGIRPDSSVDVPEPELALVVNAAGETVGLTICDDVSSRSIEGENPLYLPQAKLYAGSCALGPGIRPVWELEDPTDLAIGVRVRRGDEVRWQADTSTRLLHRSLDELVSYLRRGLHFPDGVVLSTGTGLVPELSFTLAEGDVVEVDIAGIGTLRNPVVAARPEDFAWLAAGPARRPPARPGGGQ
jgi:2-dehydro-3-deoxy-D-arabinonate dehydratase